MIFCPGQVVQLRSGGPKMTVYWTNTIGDFQGKVYCGWFDRLCVLHLDHFPPEVLMLAPTQDKQ